MYLSKIDRFLYDDIYNKKFLYKNNINKSDYNKKFYIPNFLCFGQFEIDHYKNLGIKDKNFFYNKDIEIIISFIKKLSKKGYFFFQKLRKIFF